MVRPVLGVCALDLLGQGLHRRREQAREGERAALLSRKGGAFVEMRRPKEGNAGERCFDGG